MKTSDGGDMRNLFPQKRSSFFYRSENTFTMKLKDFDPAKAN